jgi:osmoprotectant transport system ATP-binding protein
MIEISQLSKKYNNNFAIESLNLKIEKGKTTVLIGSSGSGKSTILKLILGLTLPDEGIIFINNNKLSNENVYQFRKKMGYVIQSGGLFPHLTARQNIVLMSLYLKKNLDWINSRLKYLVKLTHFPLDGLERYPIELSGGQKQRVSLMRALMLDPKVLLLDEPLSALDPMIKAELQKELKEIFSTVKKTVVFVTHDIAEAAYFGDIIILLSEGKIVQKGKISAFLSNPVNDFVTSFIFAQSHLFENMKDSQ